MSSFSWPPSSGGGGSGDVSGPGASVDNRVARFDGTTGKTIQNSPVTLDDSGNITGAGIDADNNTISNLEVDNLKSGVLDTDLSSVSASDDTLPSAKAVKAYVDAQILTKDAADEISYSNATSSLVATDVQAAIDEVEGRVDTVEANKADASALTSHTSATAAHGVSGAVVGTTDAQSLTNKTIDGNFNTISNLAHGAEVDNPSSGVHGVTGNVVGTTDAQTLTNKTLTSPVINTGISGTAILDEDNMASNSATQLATQQSIKAYVDNTVGALDTGGNGNLIDNDDFESNTSGWTVNDVSADSSVAINRVTTGSVARGTGSGEIVITASGTTAEYVENQFTLPPAYANKTLRLAFWHIDDSAYTSGDLEVVLVKDPGGTEVEYTPATTAIPSSSTWTYYESYVTVGAADTYALRFKVATGSTAMDIRIDDVFFGLGEVTQGVPQSDYTTMTTATQLLSGSGGSEVTNYSVDLDQYKRLGDSAFLNMSFSSSADKTDSNALHIKLNDFTIDTTAQPVGTVLGYASFSDSSAAARYDFPIAVGSSTELIIRDNNSSTIQVGAFDNSDTIKFTVGPVAIAEWAGSSVWLSSAKAEYASNSNTADSDDTSSFVYGPAGGAIPTITAATTGDALRHETVRFLTPIQPTDRLEIQILQNGETTWEPLGNQTYQHMTVQNGEFYGIGVTKDSSDNQQVLVQFGRSGRRPGSTYGSAGSNYPASAGDKYRVVKYPGVIQSAIPSAVKTQTKFLSADQTTDAEMTDLTFSLTAGRWYRINAHFYGTNNTSDSLVSVVIADGATTIGVVNLSDKRDTGSGFMTGVYSQPIFIQDGDLSFTTSSASANAYINGDGTRAETFVTVEELPQHIEYSGW